MHPMLSHRFACALLTIFVAALAGPGSTAGVAAQEPGRQDAPGRAGAGQSLDVPLSDPSRPGTLRAELRGGRLVVREYEGRSLRVSEQGRAPSRAAGLRVEERDNVVRLSLEGSPERTASPEARGEILVEVPAGTTLHLTATGQGSLVVQDVRGETQAGTEAGSLTATFTRPPEKALSFSTGTGDIDVVLPPDTKADVRLDRMEGEFYSDFFVEMLPAEERQIVDDKRPEGGRFHIKIEKTLRGRINGGGPEIAFRTAGGAIRIKQAR
jgi:hypothetical protein